MKFKVCFCFLLSVIITKGDSNCYDELGCFGIEYPWFSLLRPFPPPMNPEKINTIFYFADRKNTGKIHIKTWPQIEIAHYDDKRPTVFLTHGFFSDAGTDWVKNLTEAFLYKDDYNVFLVDWNEGSSTGYFQAGSNTRVVAAEIIRLICYLQSHYSIDLSQFYLMGHSLGAQIMAYVGKNLTGIGRITALDPARPGFEGKNTEVRLDNSDAKFVDVIHTDGRPFLGLGMGSSVGTVDFFVNGGEAQPGCIFDGKIYNITSISDIVEITIDVLYNLAACSHSRAARYMAVAIKDECQMLGHRYDAEYAHHYYENFVLKDACSEEQCNFMGLKTPTYPARGNFALETSGTYPFCIDDLEAVRSMEKRSLGHDQGNVIN